jgi:hypothetical protein
MATSKLQIVDVKVNILLDFEEALVVEEFLFHGEGFF